MENSIFEIKQEFFKRYGYIIQFQLVWYLFVILIGFISVRFRGFYYYLVRFVFFFGGGEILYVNRGENVFIS